MSSNKTFKEIFTEIGNSLITLAEKLDDLTIISVVVKTDPETPTPVPPVDDPYKDIYIPPFKTDNVYVRESTLIGYTKGLTGVNEPLYIVTFSDFKKRGYTQDASGKFHNKGKNIYSNPNTVIVDKSLDWGTLVIDDVTANGGNSPSKFYAKL